MREGWLSSVGAVNCVARLLGCGDVVELSEMMWDEGEEEMWWTFGRRRGISRHCGGISGLFEGKSFLP